MAVAAVPTEHANEIIGFLLSALSVLLLLLAWFGKRLLGKMENQIDGLDEEVANLHDRVLVMETNYAHCCGHPIPKGKKHVPSNNI